MCVCVCERGNREEEEEEGHGCVMVDDSTKDSATCPAVPRGLRREGGGEGVKGCLCQPTPVPTLV